MKLMKKHTLYRLMNNIHGNKTTKVNEQEVDKKLEELIKIVDKELEKYIKSLNASLLLYIGDNQNVNKIKTFIDLNTIDKKQLENVKDEVDNLYKNGLTDDNQCLGEEALMNLSAVQVLESVKDKLMEVLK